MALPHLSVVIPTYKRSAILKECLERLQKQTVAEHLEVIVVSDGHDKATSILLTEMKWGINVKYFEIEKSQQGIARNHGVTKATAPITLYIGDDIFLAPDACHKHLLAHQMHQNCAVLGFTTWDPNMDITPAMKWLEQTGWQFGYPLLTPYKHAYVPKATQHRFTYTSNISLPTNIAQKHLFRDDVTLYGWEDIIWGQQLRDAGIRLYYEPDAAALHHHMVTLDASLARIETLGKSLLHLTKVEPELDRKPTGLKLLAYKLIALTPTMRGRHYKAFLKGLQEAH